MPKKIEQFSVILPVFNTIEYTEMLMTDIRENVSLPSEIILIDDGGTDNYSELCQRFSDLPIKYHRNDIQIGCGACWNLGILLSEGDICFFLNNDILINKYLFKKVKETFELNGNIGLVGPSSINNKAIKDPKIIREEIEKSRDVPVELDAKYRKSGWAFAMKRAIIQEYGLIPAGLISWYTDFYLYKICELCNMKLVTIKNNYIYHYEMVASRKIPQFGDTVIKSRIFWNILKQAFEENFGMC